MPGWGSLLGPRRAENPPPWAGVQVALPLRQRKEAEGKFGFKVGPALIWDLRAGLFESLSKQNSSQDLALPMKPWTPRRTVLAEGPLRPPGPARPLACIRTQEVCRTLSCWPQGAGGTQGGSQGTQIRKGEGIGSVTLTPEKHRRAFGGGTRLIVSAHQKAFFSV